METYVPTGHSVARPLNAGQRSYTYKTLLYIIGVSWGSFSYGYAASVIGITLGQPSFLSYMGLLSSSNATALTSAITCIFYVGGFFGAMAAAPMSDRWGRKIAITIGSSILLIAQAILAGSVNPAMFIVFRGIIGFSSTILQATVPVWIAEIVPPKDRGMLMDIHPILINFGYCLSSWVGVGFYFYDSNGAQWRAPIGLGCTFCLMCIICVIFAPESPRWLLMHDQPEKAWTIIKKLHTREGDLTHEFAKAEFQEIKQQIEIDKSMNVSYIAMCQRPSYRKRLLIGCGLTFFSSTSGVLVINIYGTTLYKGLGYNDLSVLLFQAGWVTVGAFMNLFAILVVDRMPRPRLMLLGFLGCLGSLVGEAAVQAKYLGSSNKSALAAGVAMLYTFVFFYALLIDGPTFFYIGEIYPNHLRAKGMTLGMVVLNAMNIIWQGAAPTAFDNIGWKYYLFFIIPTAIACVVVPLTFPDTRNKPLEEIGRLFGDQDLVVDVAASDGAASSGQFEMKEPSQEHVDRLS